MTTVNRLVAIGVLTAILSAFVGSVSITVYWEHLTGSTILWNQEQGLAFVHLRRDGLRAPLAVVAWQLVRNLLSLRTELRDSREWVVALVIRPDEIQALRLDGDVPSVFSVLGGNVYAGFDRNLVRWTGRNFVPADEFERKRFAENTTGRERSFSNVDGWSSRVNLLSDNESAFDLHIGGRTISVVTVTTPEEKAIVITLPNGERVRALSITTGPTFVRGAKFEELFR